MRKIYVTLDKLQGSEHEGFFLDSSSYDEVVDEDCEVFDKSSGEKIVDFRKGVLSNLREEYFDFFKKVAKSSINGNRGLATGRELQWKVGSRTRLSSGQKNVIEKGKSKKGLSSFQEIEKILEEGRDPSNFFWLQGNFEERNWEGFLEELKNTSPTKWGEMFSSYRTQFVDTQARSTGCYSNVFGAFGRTGRNPYCRLSTSTQRWENKYYEYADFYQKIDQISEDAFPDKHAKMKGGLESSDEHFTLLGTAFTSITVNWNFRLASHFDGRNFPGGFATLTVFEKGSFEGHFLVFPEIRLAFNLRQGDTISADTCELLHGNTSKVGDGERVSLVFFTRKDIADKCHSRVLDEARKAFCKFAKENLHDKYNNGRKGWQGNYPNMFDSPEWYEFLKNYTEEEINLKESDKLLS